MAWARVDFPEPFGPMMAWVSPDLMVRLTPLRISTSPCSVSMLTCRSLISRVDIVVKVSLLPVGYGSFGNGYKRGLELKSGDFFFHDFCHGFFDFLDADLLDDFVEETTYDQLACDRLWDTPSHKVEQLLFIKASNGGCVTTGVDDAGF